MDVPPQQTTTPHPRPLPPLRASLQHLSPALPLLPHPVPPDRRYITGLHIATSWAPRLAVRALAICDFGAMGQRGEPLGQKAHDYNRVGAVYHIEHRLWLQH